MEWAFRKLNWEDHGINTDGKKLGNMRFAKDTLFMGTSREEVREMVKTLSQACEEARLQMNTFKTKYMSNRSKENLKMNGREIEKVGEYGEWIILFEQRPNKELQEEGKRHGGVIGH